MKFLKLFLLSLVASASAQASAVFANFDQNHFEGWIYTRPNFELNTYNISTNRITLFTASNGNEYTLISPAFETAGAKYVCVDFLWVSDNYNDHDKYNLTKGSPTIELMDLNGNVLKTKTYQLREAALEHNVTVYLKVPGAVEDVKVRLRAPFANADCCGAVRTARISGSDNDGVLPGDVNGNGKVDVADVTALINMILGVAETKASVADVNGNGIVDVADVTALINLILVGNNPQGK